MKVSRGFLIPMILFSLICVPWRGNTALAATDFSQVAGSGEYAAAKNITKYGMLPVYGQDVEEGSYAIEVKSSSSFFRITDAMLTVAQGEMTAEITISSHSYSHIYPGTGLEASVLTEADFIPAEEKNDRCTFRFPVAALNRPLPCAAFSRKREKWYDRNILFDASSLPQEALRVDLPDYDRIEEGLELLEQKENNTGSTSGEKKTGGKLIIAGQTNQETEPETSENTSGTPAEPSDTSENTTGTSAEPSVTSENTTGTPAKPSVTSENMTGTSMAFDEDIAQGITLAGNDPYAPVEAMEVNLEDGEYAIEVNMTGGSGRASVSSPTYLIIREGRAYARLIWSSTYYDYMIVGGEKYLNESTDGGNSSFTIPIAQMDAILPVIADTTAMGDPVAIHYSLTFYRETIGERGLIPQEAAKKVLAFGAVVIIFGGILNYLVKKKKYK